MLLIYTHKISPRFSYTMRHLFVKVLGIEIKFTTLVEDFIKHTGPKITYTKQPLQNEFFIRSNDLLFEQGINQFEIKLEEWEGLPCFFTAGPKSSIPYDIFAASFFLLSRYEEYLPFVKDIHGRFPPTASIAYKHDFLHLPVVDLWAFKLLEQLQERFPDIKAKKRNFRYRSLIDVTASHCFAFRGAFRSLGGLLLDMVTFKFKRVFQRIAVLLKIRKDPYDNFTTLRQFHKKYPCKSIFFFQFADYSTYDKNVSTENNKFRYLIKSVADYSRVSLAASYSSFDDLELLKQEKKRLSEVIHRPVSQTRMRYNRLDIPQTYRNLVEAEFKEDFSMGYTHVIGFRAGTCSSFNFYDIHMELQQPIIVHPFAVHDYALLTFETQDEILEALKTLYINVKEVRGEFTTVFSNELLGGSQKLNWLKLYENLLVQFHV
jgi:hypothetical protein